MRDMKGLPYPFHAQLESVANYNARHEKKRILGKYGGDAFDWVADGSVSTDSLE